MDISQKALANIQKWQQPPFDEKTIGEAKALLDSKDSNRIEQLFGSDIHFGTAGMRGPATVGPAGLNLWTVGRATVGLCRALRQMDQSGAVVIGYDPRLTSEAFANQTARVCAAFGFKVYLSDGIRPTPWVSFACRYLSASAAIMITASHNPKEDNGYKVYLNDGGQVVPPRDALITKEVLSCDYTDIQLSDPHDPLIEKIGEKIDAAFLETTDPRFFLKIAYSPLYGAGYDLVPKGLKRAGYHALFLVDDEKKPDGHFPKYPYPNPEVDSVMGGVVETMIKNQCLLGLASDPDSDRIRAATWHHGSPILLSGNQMAILMTDYLLRHNAYPQEKIIISSIVSSPMIAAITAHYGASHHSVLTGFKYIGAFINELENRNELHRFLFGCEESCGFLSVHTIRDKDAISSAILMAQIAEETHRQGQSLIDSLYTLYEKYGVYRELQKALSQSQERIASGMEKLQKAPIEGILARVDLSDPKEAQRYNLPPSPLFILYMEQNIRLLIRPSGTEPKVKIYGQIGPIATKDSVEERILYGESLLESKINVVASLF